MFAWSVHDCVYQLFFQRPPTNQTDQSTYDPPTHPHTTRAQQGNYTTADTYKYFVDFAARSAIAANRAPVQWVEVWDEFGPTLHPETVVHVWKEKGTARPIVEAGYRALLSDNDV